MVRSFFANGRLLRQMNHFNLVLILKLENHVSIGQFRPINLCNVNYKIMSKIMVGHLRLVLPKLISGNQNAFSQSSNPGEYYSCARTNVYVTEKTTSGWSSCSEN